MEKDTKSHQARRIALDAVTIALLEEHLQRCRARPVTCGAGLRAVLPGRARRDGLRALTPNALSYHRKYKSSER